MVYEGFIGQAYRAQSISAAGDLLINLYPEILESAGASKAVYYGTPGTSVWCTLPTLPIRGETSLDSYAFAVGGNALYQLNPDKTFRQCGGSVLPGGTSPVSMQTDGITVVMAVSNQLWVYVIATDTLQPIDTSIVAGAGQVSYSDGYFLVNVPGTAQFNISALNDGTSWSGLDFGVKGGFPDIVIGHILDHRELWLFGSRTIEVWWNSGAANFPWERIQGPFIQSGLGAAFSLSRGDNTHSWLHQDERGARMIWKAVGYSPQRISTFALEYALAGYARVDDAIAYDYQENGHSFYLISFPSAVLPVPGNTNKYGATWVLDHSNNMWHQRDYLDAQFGQSQQVRGWVHAYAFGRHLVGDYQNGNIYDQSVNYLTDAYSSQNPAAVNRIRRLRRAPHILQEHARIFYPGFELHIQQGVVPQSGPGSTPIFNLRKSPDGGFTWSNYIPAQAGLVGQFRNRLLWRKLGQARDAVFEVSSDEPIQHAWINAYLHPDPQVSDR